MEPDEMRAEADRLTGIAGTAKTNHAIASIGDRIALWQTAAEICERLDALLAQNEPWADNWHKVKHVENEEVEDTE